MLIVIAVAIALLFYWLIFSASRKPSRAELHRQMVELGQKYSTQTQTIAELMAEVGDCKTAMNTLSGQLAKAGADAADLQQQLTASQVKVVDLRQQLSAVADLRQQLSAKQAKVADLQQQLSAEQATLGHLRQQLRAERRKVAEQPQTDRLRQFRALAAQTLHPDRATPADKACCDRLFKVLWPKIEAL